MATEKEKTLPFAMEHLPDYYKEKARRELNETPERKVKALEEMKEMARDHHATCDIEFVDDFLLQFLRQKKNDVPRAFKQLVNFVNFRKNNSSFLLSIDNGAFYSDPRRQFSTILPRRCPEGCTIILNDVGKWHPDEISFHDFLHTPFMLISQALRDPMTQINGFKIILDFTDASLKHMRYCTPTKLYRIHYIAMNCFPCRYKKMHLVSNSPILKTAWAVVQPFISPKLKQRALMNPSRKDLLDHFPASVLPVQYGGLLEDYYMMEWTKEAYGQQEGFTLRGQRNYY